MTSSKGLYWILISFIIGITAESFYIFPKIIILGFLISGFIISFLPFFIEKLKRHQKFLIVLGFSILFFCLALLRLQMVQFKIENDPVVKFNDRPERIELFGRIISEPDIKSNYQSLKVKVNETNSIVLVSTNLYQTYHYLDEVRITGKLETPISEGNFNYKNYLMKDGIYSLMGFPEIEIISLGHSSTGESQDHHYSVASFLYEKILFLKVKMQDSIKSNYSPPGSFIIEGVILGNDKNMSQDLKDKFNSAGLSHITAVSGSNIFIMVSIIMPILLFFGFFRQKALYLTLIFVWVYVVLVGLPASAVRAAIMASIFLLSKIIGRQNNGSRTIIIAATIMVFQNPLVLFYDIGFQLSFLASMGIIHLKPIIDNAFYYLLKKRKNIIKLFKKIKMKNLIDIFSTTLVAQIFTLPIIIYDFQTISLVALITNLLLLPIISLLTFMGLFSVILGIFSRFLGWIFYLPCQFMLIYFLKILDIFYQPWARISISISFILCIAYYVVLFIFVWLINKKMQPNFLEY